MLHAVLSERGKVPDWPSCATCPGGPATEVQEQRQVLSGAFRVNHLHSGQESPCTYAKQSIFS